jgi:hypothetical protein
MVGAGTVGVGVGVSVVATAGGGVTFLAQPVPINTTAAKHKANKHNISKDLFIACASFHNSLVKLNVCE